MSDGKIFETKINPNHKYGVGVYTTAKIVGLLTTCETLDQLKIMYAEAKNFASSMNITQPLPVEIMREGPKLMCKVVKELM